MPGGAFGTGRSRAGRLPAGGGRTGQASTARAAAARGGTNPGDRPWGLSLDRDEASLLLRDADIAVGGDDRLVSEYMEAEFLARISRRWRVFLTRTVPP